MAEPARVHDTLDANGASRLVHFRDPRPPEEVRTALERALKVLFSPERVGSQLTLRSDSRINGAACRLTLIFEAALKISNSYSLRIDISWADLPEASREYHRKAAAGWLDVWTRDLSPASPPAPHENSPQRYEALVQQTLSAESHLDSVAKLQAEVLARLRNGASFSTAHKEGGTRIYWQGGRFIRSDYGDNESEQSFDDERAFLAFLRRFFDHEIARGTDRDKVSEEAAWRLILRLMQDEGKGSWGRRASSRSPGAPSGAAFVRRLARVRAQFGLIVAGVALAGAVAWFGLSNVFTVKTIGAPLAPAVGSPDAIAVLIVTQERYVPSLHRDPSKDKFRVALLVQPRDEEGSRQMIPIAGQLDASESRNAARMLGFDGKIFWFVVREIVGYDASAKRLVRLDDLRRANPELQSLWPIGYYEVDTRLRVSTRDNRIRVEIDPHTLVARPLREAPVRKHILPSHPAKAMLTPAPAAGDGTLDRAYVRESFDAPPLRPTPDSMLLTYWRKSENLQRVLFVARVDANGRTLWETEIDIGDLQQVLPDKTALALIGTRPRQPDKVSEPVLVIVNNDSGRMSTHGLWIHD